MWHLAKFQPKEIIELAVEIEKTGGQFYRDLAAKSAHEQIKKLLLFLAAEEDQHQVRFRELGKDLETVNVPETYSGEYTDYIGSIVDTHMFNDASKNEQMVINAQSGLDIIKLATDFEKETILFLNGFRNLINKDKIGVIEDLIMEEQIHLVKLARLRKEVLTQNGK